MKKKSEIQDQSSNNFLIKIQDSITTPVVSKQNAATTAQRLYDSILEEKTNPIRVVEGLKFMELVGEELKKLKDENGKNSFIQLVRDEIETKGDFDGNSKNKVLITEAGTKLELFEAATKYDYSVCGDPLWAYYESKVKEYDEKKKDREKYLKTIKKTFPVGNILNEETAELFENVELSGPVRNSTSTFKATLNG